MIVELLPNWLKQTLRCLRVPFLCSLAFTFLAYRCNTLLVIAFMALFCVISFLGGLDKRPDGTKTPYHLVLLSTLILGFILIVEIKAARVLDVRIVMWRVEAAMSEQNNIETVEETRTLLFGIHSNLNFDGYSVYYRPNWEWDRDWILDLDTGIWRFG